MKPLPDNLATTSASLLAVTLMLGATATASAVQINANTDLNNVNGTVRTGTYNASGPTNVNAQLGFSVPQGAFGDDFSSVAGSSNSIDFSTSVNGNIATADSGLSGSLTADNSFNNGSAFNNFLMGGNQVPFDSISFDFEYDSLNGRLGVLALDDPSASITNLIFAGDGRGLANITGGTLNLSGNNVTLAVLDIYGTLTGDGKLVASSDGSGGSGNVPVDAPSGPATVFLMSLGLIGIGAAAKRRQRQSQDHDSLSGA